MERFLELINILSTVCFVSQHVHKQTEYYFIHWRDSSPSSEYLRTEFSFLGELSLTNAGQRTLSLWQVFSFWCFKKSQISGDDRSNNTQNALSLVQVKYSLLNMRGYSMNSAVGSTTLKNQFAFNTEHCDLTWCLRGKRTRPEWHS